LRKSWPIGQIGLPFVAVLDMAEQARGVVRAHEVGGVVAARVLLELAAHARDLVDQAQPAAGLEGRPARGALGGAAEGEALQPRFQAQGGELQAASARISRIKGPLTSSL
jgi:hypothetical protein